MKRKFLATLLALAMILSLLPTVALATGDFVEMTIDGTTVTYSDSATFIDALSAAENKTIDIKLLSDLEISGTVKIKEGQIVTLDLNGKKLSTTLRSDNNTKHYYALDNYGTFTLKDSLGDGSIVARGIENLGKGTMTIESGRIISCDSNGGAAIWNEANLLVKGGTFETVYVGTASDSVGIGCLNNSGTALITGGTFNDVNKRTYAIISTGKIEITPATEGTVTVTGAHGGLAIDSGSAVVNGGSYSSTDYYGLYVSNDGVGVDPMTAAVTVNAGTFDGPNYSVWIGSDYNNPVNSTIEINGGIYNKPLNAQACTREGAIVVKGGTFSSDPSGYVNSATHVVSDPVGGKYTVTARNETNSEAKIGDVYYDTLAHAIAATDSGDTVTLLKNATMGKNTLSGQDVNLIIELNNKTLTMSGSESTFVTGGAKLTIQNGAIEANGFGATTGVFRVESGSSITLDHVTANTSGAMLFPRGDAAKVTVEDSSITTTKAYCVTTNAGSAENYNVQIVLENSSFSGWSPVLVNVPCSLEMTNCTVTGTMHGVVVRGGTATITGGTITLQYDDDDAEEMANYFNNINWGQGNMLNLGALIVGNKGTNAYQYPSNVTVTGTKIQTTGATGAAFPAIYTYANAAADKGVTLNIGGMETNVIGSVVAGNTDYNTISITGGTFSTDPSTYVDGSYITKKNNNTEYVVIPKSDLTEGVYMSDPRTALAEGYTATESNGVWTVAKKTYTVTFDSKGGSAVSSQTVDHGEKVIKPTDPVREGYGFGNWFKDAGLTEQFNFNTYTVTNDVTLYAKWVPNTYTVSFDSKGGSAVPSQPVSYGEKVTRPDNPTKTGYTFDNWYEGSNEFNFDTYTVTNDVTLYAKWDINTYTVTFNSNGGSEVAPVSAEYNSTITAPAAPTKSGYTFAGWFTDSGLTTAYDFATPVTGNVELYAKWNVIYVDDGDSGSSGGSSSTTETTENPDGSTTTTVTDKTTGTVTETTTGKPVTDEDGNTTQTTTEVVTNKDGSKAETTTETVTNADGSSSETKTETVTNADGETTSTETVKATDTTGTTATKVTETNAAGESTTSVEATVSDKAVDEAVKGEAPVVLPVEVSATKAEETAAAPVVKVEVPDTVSSESTVKVEIPVENATPGTVAVLVKEDGTEEIIKTSTLGENGVVLTLDGSATVKIVDNSKHFEDVHPVDHWAGDTIDFVSSREIFSGTGKNTFSPDVAMTRAMLMTVLARYDGEDTTTGATWYEKGMDWAKAKGVSDGTNPDANVTREQLATMLYRYAGSPEHNGALNRFPDADAVNSYAADAMRWAVENGIIGGMGDGTLNPQGDATRAEVAAVLARFCGGQTK